MVITTTRPSEQELTDILQPWHEFECTGEDDQYVVNIDKTEEAFAAYDKATVHWLKASDGTLHNPFDENGNWKPEFSQEDPGGLDRRKKFVPPGYEEVELPASEMQSAAEWISEYYGWGIVGTSDVERLKYGVINVDGKGDTVSCFDRTNPNKKWDWWTVGGRFSNRLGPGCNQTQKHNVPIDFLRSSAEAKELVTYDEVQKVRAGRSVKTWAEVRSALPPGAFVTDEIRDSYWHQPVIQEIQAKIRKLWDGPDEYLVSRDLFRLRVRNRALACFAIVKDGKWYQRGEMGWWGAVHDEKDEDAWHAEFNKMYDELPSDVWLTVVDCHI